MLLTFYDCRSTGTGALFVACWPLYTDAWESRYLASSVPLAASLYFYLVGSGVVNDQSLVDGACRNSHRKELLLGPLTYGLVHTSIALTYWCKAEAVIAIGCLCGGDGLAEIVGRKVQSSPLFYNRRKTIAGSLACLFGGIMTSTVLLQYLQQHNTLYAGPTFSKQVFIGNIVGSFVESLPMLANFDNLTVPLSVLMTASLLAD